MNNVHIWLFATQIVGLSVIVMFAVYVLLFFFDFKKYRNRQIDKEEEKKALLVAANETLKEIQEENKETQLLIEELRKLRNDITKHYESSNS